MADNKKIANILSLMARLARGEELYPQSAELQDAYCTEEGNIKAKERKLRRYLKEIHEQYSDVVLVEKTLKEFSERKVEVYRVANRKKDVADTFAYFLENGNDLGWLLQMVHENDPDLLTDTKHKKDVEKLMKRDKGTFLFKSSPFENLDNRKISEIFNQFKIAVQRHEYKKIKYNYGAIEYLDAKCLKLIYMNNNWYAAIEDENKKVRLLRLAFIEEVTYSSKNSFQPSSVVHFEEFFDRLQNPMTIEAPRSHAVLRASPKVAIYFQDSMKQFFLTQKFIKKHEDGSVEFNVEFTQSIEILPFIKQWLPDITIISPKSLQEALVDDLKTAIISYI